MYSIIKRYKAETTKIVAGAVTFLLSFSAVSIAGEALWWLYLIPYLVCGYDTLYKMIRNLIRLDFFDETFLMGIATIGAICIGEYPEAVAVMLLYRVGELFERVAVARSRESIAALSQICPHTAHVLRDGKLTEIETDKIDVGDIVIAGAGELIAVDGVIVEGEGEFDLSSLSGESMPVHRSVGDRIYSGTLNLNSYIKYRAEKKAEESTAAKILRITVEASAKKAKTEKFITRFSRVYTPSVVAAAVVLAFLPPLLSGNFGASFSVWLHRALIFLVVSCPCALVISVPLGFFAGIGSASRQGIMICGSGVIEKLARAHTAVFDKTGTLTEGRLSISEVKVFDKIGEQELVDIAASLESYSNHPIARTISECSRFRQEYTDIREIPGEGICAEHEGERLLCGNTRLMHRFGLTVECDDICSSVVYVARGEKVIGAIYLSDTVKENANATIKELSSLGVEDTVMLTGDRDAVAAGVASGTGVGRYMAELDPEGKLEQLQRCILTMPVGRTLLYVGDGINDAPSLSRADVGISMGALGSDAAIEAADVVIMDDDIGKVPRVIIISKRTVRKVRQNILLALGFKSAVMILGVLGIAGMGLAVIADVGVSVLAIINSMSLLTVKDPKTH